MRITEVLLRPGLGGAETLVEQLGRHWSAEGHTTATVYVEPDGRARGRLERIAGLSHDIAATAPDVVHAHSAMPNLYARLASRGRWPVVTVLHSAGRDFDTTSVRIAERLVRRWTAHVVAVSEAQVREYRQRFGDTAAVSLVPNGVRGDIVARSAPRSRLRNAVAISRLDPQKRIDVLLTGWARAGLDAELSVAGAASDPDTQNEVDAWAADTAGARLLGRVSDVPSLLARSDLLVHAADAEAHPLAPLEAACAGLPVVVSTAVADTLPDRLVKVTFPTGDPDGLAVALRDAAARYPELARAATRAAAGLAVEFSLATCAGRHLDVLNASGRR